VDIENIYEKYSIKHNKGVRNFQFKKSIYWNRQAQRIEKILDRGISSVLDIGCRTGDFLMHFPDSLVREGVELSKNLAEIAEKKRISNISRFCGKYKF